MCEVFEFIVTCLHQNYCQLIDSFSSTIKTSVQMHLKGITTDFTGYRYSDKNLLEVYVTAWLK